MAGGVTDRDDLKAYFAEAASWDHDRLIAANRQFRTIDEEAAYAERWFLGLTETGPSLNEADEYWTQTF